MTTSRTEKDAWKDALHYLLRYEDRGNYRYQRVMRAKHSIEEMLQKGAYGELTSERFVEIRDSLDLQEHRIARDAWTTNIHGVVHTTEWMDRLASGLEGKTVLEIGAFRGCLMQPMNKRGVTWIGVQVNPDKDCVFKPIPVQDYLEALKGYRKTIDLIFVAWPAYTLKGYDFMSIVKTAVEYDIPMLIVAERRVFTSSTNDLWDNQHEFGYRLIQAREHDPDRWRGVRDSLWVMVDEKHLTKDGDRSKFMF